VKDAPTFSRSLILLGMVSLPSTHLAACGPPCPWTHITSVAIEPPTPCLSVSVPAIGDDPLTDPNGCLNPDFIVGNHCSMVLAISDMNVDSVLADGGGLSCPDGGPDSPWLTVVGGCAAVTLAVEPGQTTEFEIYGFGAGKYVVPASLGSTALSLSFSTY
jgi:hypothetical protein